ncbi:MAG: ABC transporter permease [Alphaproteobacteria bacterium]
MRGRRIGGAFVIGLVALIAMLAPVLAPHDPLKSSVFFLQGSTADYLLGTDDLGRDVLSRLLYGARSSLTVGLGAALAAALVGVPIGLAAGYFRGNVDLAIVFLIDIFIALPALILALFVVVMIGPSVINLVVVLGLVMWPQIARLVRGQTLAVREATFIEAARASGGTPAWIITRHVLPNIMRVIAAQFAITVSFSIFTSASLSFLGLGIPPPTPDWGGMVRAGYEFLTINPWVSLAPGTAVALTVMGFYMIGSSAE